MRRRLIRIFTVFPANEDDARSCSGGGGLKEGSEGRLGSDGDDTPLLNGVSYRGITGNVRCEACSGPWRTVCSATTISASMPGRCPVFRFRSKRGKLLLDTSTRSLCPALKTLAVSHRSMAYSYTLPGSISVGSSMDSRNRARRSPSQILMALPLG